MFCLSVWFEFLGVGFLLLFLLGEVVLDCVFLFVWFGFFVKTDA